MSERTTIIDGEVKQLSVTSIAKFDPEQRGGCPRKGHYHYVQGLEEPTGKGAGRGIETHDKIAKYFIPQLSEDGTTYVIPSLPRDKLAQKAIKWFNKNRDWTMSGFELPFKMAASGIILVGKVDVKHDIEILDWKTTTKPIEELPSAASLIHTIQMPGYAKWLLDCYPQLDEVQLTHVYLSTKYDPVEVTATFDRAVILERWQEIEGKIEQIKRIVKLDIAQVEPNLKACEAYGGCYYRNICEHGKAKGMTKMGILEGLKKAKKEEPKLESVEEVKEPGPFITRVSTVEEINSILPPDAPEPSLKKRGRPVKSKSEEKRLEVQEGETYFKGKVTKVSLGRTLNLGQFEGVRIDLEYQVEEGDHMAAFNFLRHEMTELEGYFRKGE